MGKNHAKAPLLPWPLRLHVAGVGASDDTHTFLDRPGGGFGGVSSRRDFLLCSFFVLLVFFI